MKTKDKILLEPSSYKGQLKDSYIPSFKEYFELVEKKEKRDRCLKKADSVYGKKTSAYKSGAVVKCRQGKIWKKKK